MRDTAQATFDGDYPFAALGVEFGPNLAEFSLTPIEIGLHLGPDLGDFGRACRKSDVCPTSAQIWWIPGPSRPNFADRRPTSTQVWSTLAHSVDQLWRCSAEAVPALADIGPNPADFGQVSAELRPTSTNSGRSSLPQIRRLPINCPNVADPGMFLT